MRKQGEIHLTADAEPHGCSHHVLFRYEGGEEHHRVSLSQGSIRRMRMPDKVDVDEEVVGV